MKKIIFSTCIVLCFFSFSFSQNKDTLYHGNGDCCPFINYLVIEPSNPTGDESVKLLLSITTPNSGEKISSDFNILNDTIKITTCYWKGIAGTPRILIDTFLIGKMDVGNYIIDVSCFSSEDMDCTVIDSNLFQTSFSIVETSISSTVIADKVLIYPNPFNSVFKLNADQKNIERINIYNIYANQLKSYHGNYNEFDLKDIPDGVYILSIHFENYKITNRKIIKASTY